MVGVVTCASYNRPMSATRPLPRSAIEAPPRAAGRSAARWPLGGVRLDQFLRDHWQRRPLLVRGAVPEAPAPLSADALVELAARDTVESRLVSATGGRWRLQHGPLDASAVPSLTRPRW